MRLWHTNLSRGSSDHGGPETPRLPQRRAVKEPQSNAFFLLGVVTTIATFAIVISMFTSRPVTSEEDEIIASVTAQVKMSEKEWVSPEVLSRDVSLAVGEQGLALALYRLRLFVYVDPSLGEATARLRAFLGSLLAAHYTNRSFPIDLEVRVVRRPPRSESRADRGLGHRDHPSLLQHEFLQTLANVEWRHGRYTVMTVAPPARLAEVWLPMSDWELAAFVDLNRADQPPRLAASWYSWVERAVQAYGTTPREGFRALGEQGHTAALAATDRTPIDTHDASPTSPRGLLYDTLRSPIGDSPCPRSLLGLALDIPYAAASYGRATAKGAAPGAKAAIGSEFAAWLGRQTIDGSAYLAQRPALLGNIFFPRAWRRLTAAFDVLDTTSSTSTELPFYTAEFQQLQQQTGMYMLFPFHGDPSVLLSDRSSLPLFEQAQGAALSAFPDYFHLVAFDAELTRTTA